VLITPSTQVPVNAAINPTRIECTVNVQVSARLK